MHKPMLKTFVQDFLIKYECPIEYLGFSQLVDTLCIACEDWGEVKNNLKSIYIVVCQKHKITRLSLERNLHTLVKVWSTAPKFKLLFDEIPTNAKLISTLAFKVQRPDSSVYDIYLLP